MRLYKHKTEETRGGEPTQLEQPAWASVVRIESIYYSSDNPADKLRLLDKDKDEVWYVTGHGQEQADRAVILDLPLTLEFPLYFLDERTDGKNKVIIRGYLVDSPGIDKSL